MYYISRPKEIFRTSANFMFEIVFERVMFSHNEKRNYNIIYAAILRNLSHENSLFDRRQFLFCFKIFRRSFLLAYTNKSQKGIRSRAQIYTLAVRNLITLPKRIYFCAHFHLQRGKNEFDLFWY